MTRGNQRELARAKNQKKDQGKGGKVTNDKSGNASLTLEQRRQRDADRLREKQLKKDQSDAAAAAGSSSDAKKS